MHVQLCIGLVSVKMCVKAAVDVGARVFSALRMGHRLVMREVMNLVEDSLPLILKHSDY